MIDGVSYTGKAACDVLNTDQNLAITIDAAGLPAMKYRELASQSDKSITGHGEEVYIGQIVGLHSRDNDLPVNPTKAKQLTNIRAAGTDENLILVPHINHTLEQALEFIEEDELVEVTPESIRLRKQGRVRI